MNTDSKAPSALTPEQRSPDNLCKRCRHSFAQHTKGPVEADYCRHCACPGGFVPYSSNRRRSILPLALEEMARAQNLMNNPDQFYD